MWSYNKGGLKGLEIRWTIATSHRLSCTYIHTTKQGVYSETCLCNSEFSCTSAHCQLLGVATAIMA